MFFYNNAGFSAGAIAVKDYSTTVTATKIYNCTIYNNNTTSTNGCAIFLADAKSSQIKNCIIWGNTSAGTSYGITKYAAPDYQFSDLVNNNIIQRGYVANWDFDPQFINPANPIGADNIWGTADDGLRLQPVSLACNNGTPDITGLPLPDIDIAGSIRVQDGRIDMGAYETTFACNATHTIYVDESVTVSGDGSSWATAYKSYYHGIAAANRCPNITSIMVAQGAYLPPAGSTFTMLPGVKIYGGFPTGGAPFNQRDPAAHETKLHGSGNRVIFNYKSLDTTDLLDGFTITGGVNAGPSSAGNATGGGIFNLNTNPAINNCIISDNSVAVTGGMGGGMYNTGSNPLITHCTFISNTAVAYGYPGGGGAMWNYLSAPTIRYCNFINNSTSYGGAVKNGTGCYVTISNCVFTGNSASADAGAIENNGAAVVKVINCTFVNNSAAGGGGGIDNYNSTLVLTNTLFWNNTAAHDADLWDEQNSVQATYNFFQSSRAGTGNIEGTTSPVVDIANPAGADGIWYTADDGLKLTAASVCINAGTPDTTGLLIGDMDIASSDRVVGSGIDIGAYEFNDLSLPVRLISFQGNLENSIASLQWQSADEWDFKQFDIEKSTDAVRFLQAGEVPAKGSGTYTHQVPQKEPVAYYRLKMVDINGRITTSRTIRLTQKTSHELFIYPNPASSYLQIRVAAAGSMSLYTGNGTLVKKITLQAGINTVAISDLIAGVYHIMVNGDRATFIKK